MSEHKIEFDAECKSCGGTGLYVGFGERDGAAVVCHNCKGTGKVHEVITYDDFCGKKKKKNIKRVFETNPGVGIGSGETERYGEISLEDFGGMTYDDWFCGKKFPKKSEMRKFTCPAWWYQSVDYDKKPKWKECMGAGTFSSCKYFETKGRCWEKFDKEQDKKRRQ